jgi:hypothetical protein
MVAAVMNLIWRDVGVTELTRMLAREGFLWCEPKQVIDIHLIATLSHRKRFDSLSQGIPTSGTAKVASPMGWLTLHRKLLL